MEEIAIGRLNAPYGLKGQIRTVTYSGEAAHFKKLDEVILEKDGRRIRHTLAGVDDTKNGLLLRFKGIDNPEDAKKLLGYEIFVSPDKAAKCKKNEYYVRELAGCSLIYDGVVKATVKSVLDGNSSSMLECVLLDDKICIVPFMNEYIGDVDIEARTIVLKVLWILE